MVIAGHTIKIDEDIIISDLFIHNLVGYTELWPVRHVDCLSIAARSRIGGVLILVWIGLLVDDSFSEQVLIKVIERWQVG